MSVINGIAKKYDGTAIDYVSVFNWTDGKCIAQVVPDASGAWSYKYSKNLNIGVTYIADGCKPLTHGAYDLEYISLLPLDGLVLHYSFNGDAIDSSPSKIDAATYQSPTFVVGRNDKLCINTANGGFYTVSNVPFGTKQITISMWLKMQSNEAYQCILETVSKSLAVWFNDVATMHIEVSSKANASSSLHVRTARVLELGTWNHFVFTVDRELDANNAARLYINDIEATSTTGAGSYNTISNEVFNNDVVSLGLRRNNSSFRFNGLVQDVRIYNRILNQEERTALFNE